MYPLDYLPKLIFREDWDAKDPKAYINTLDNPASYVIVTHAPAVNRCFSKVKCIKAVRALQKFHMDKGAPDLPYNFLIGEDRNIYEGRGWFQTVPVPPETPDLEGKSIVIAVIGPMRDYTKDDMPTMLDFKEIFSLVVFGLDFKLIDRKTWDWKFISTDWNTYKTCNCEHD